MYKYSKEHGCVINTEEPQLAADSPRLHKQHSSIQYTIDAIELAGGCKIVANKFNISAQAVRYWMTFSEHGVSAQYAVDLSKMTGGRITPEQLLPHVFKEYK